MIIYNKMQKKGSKRSFFFFESKDLKNWTETSVLEDIRVSELDQVAARR